MASNGIKEGGSAAKRIELETRVAGSSRRILREPQETGADEPPIATVGLAIVGIAIVGVSP